MREHADLRRTSTDLIGYLDYCGSSMMLKELWNRLRGKDRGIHAGAATGADVRRLEFATYDEYLEAQLKTNAVKRDRVWVFSDELETLATTIQQRVPLPKFGLCHGVRNGAEVRKLRELLGCEIWGTEISPSASDFEYVIQWDFHQVKPEWLGQVDFIYSNSLDHSFDPAACLTAWLSCLSPNGHAFIHWSKEHDHTDFGKHGSDCFQATRQGYQQLIESVGRLEEIVETSPQDARCLMICRPRQSATNAA